MLVTRTLIAGAVCAALATPAHADGPAPSSASAARVSLPDSPASVRGLGGSATVSVFSAQVQYGVPMSLPAGRAGFAPSIGLGYSGDLGNGPVGVGWNISSASIRRSVREGVPTFTNADEFELVGLGSGGRLIPIPDGTYRVEAAGNALRVERKYEGWKVTDSDGVIYYMGRTEASRLQDGPGRNAAWFPELIVHPSGEYAEYVYRSDQSQLYLESITWGPDRRFEAFLTYENRRDPVGSFRQGFRVTTALRLASVQVRNDGVELSAYHLTYDTGEDFPLSRLESVRMTGYLGNGQLPELTFGYAKPGPPRATALSDVNGWHLGQRGTTFFDVDGDGMDDLYRLEMGNHEWRQNRGGTFGPRTSLPGATSLELGAVRFMDLDGDARPELVRVVDDTWRYSRLVDGEWNTVGTWPGSRNVPLSGPAVATGDINGDGRTDVIEAVTGGIRVTLNSKEGLLLATYHPHINATGPPVEPGMENVRFTDVNGDGLVDVTWLTDEWMKVFLGRGDGTFLAWRRTFYPWPSAAIDLGNIKLVDLNRDGLADLVRFTAGNVLYYPGSADGSYTLLPRHVSRPASSPADVTVQIADANGNGSQDIVWSAPEGMWVLDLAGATSAGMLESIDNGMGQVVSIEYAASAQLAVESELAGEPWQRLLPVSVPVPVSSTIDVGDGSPLRTVFYGVRDGFWDGEERRFGGFLEGRQTTPADNATDVSLQVTRFLAGDGEDRVLRGSAWYVQIENGLGVVHTMARTEWHAHPIGDLPHHPLLRVPVQWETRTAHYEGVSAPIETLSWSEFDDQGRSLADWNLGRLDISGDETRVERTYATDETDSWIRNRVYEETQMEEDGTLLAKSRILYGDITGAPLAGGTIGEGLIRETLAWFDEEARWVRRSAILEYGEYWNPLRVVEGPEAAAAQLAERQLTYDSSGLYLQSESTSPNATTTLTWQLGWDLVRSLATSTTDPSGIVTQVTHDDLGRLSTIANGINDPHTHILYDWASAAPTTTTYVYDGDPATLNGSWTGGWSASVPWRENVAVANGAGEAQYSATRLAASSWIVNGWQRRDEKGRTTHASDAFYWDSAMARGAVPPANNPEQVIEYDAFDRVRRQILPTGAEKRIEYGAFEQTLYSDGLVPVTSWFDGQSRISRTQRIVGITTESVDATYDGAGRLVQMRLQAGLPDEVDHAFTYDTLGRMVYATDPDIGSRTLDYDDADRLTTHTNAAMQSIGYEYDKLGRLLKVIADDGSEYVYTYDVPDNVGDTFVRTAGRLASVLEPAGLVQFNYDAYGRQDRFWRYIETGRLGAESSKFSPSGLLLQLDHEDGLVLDYGYDPAGRATSVGEYWTLDTQDASGRILGETFGNGVTQSYGRDVLGQPTSIGITNPAVTSLYSVNVAYNAWGGITTVADTDGRGLDHDAAFTYDGAARLTQAVLGKASAGTEFTFSYAYDGLQNMVTRTETGPKSLGSFSGLYSYGESGGPNGNYGPRQLTSIRPTGDPTGTPLSTYNYDAAGRQISQNNQTLIYNGFDQLVEVTGVGAGGTGTVSHVYGYEGFRVKTINAAGSEQLWFSPSTTEKDGARDHYIRIGDRIIARVNLDMPPPVPYGGMNFDFGDAAGGCNAAASTALAQRWASHIARGIGVLGLLFIVVITARVRRRRRWMHSLASFLAVLVFTGGCQMMAFDDTVRGLFVPNEVLYFHNGIGPGPMVITRDDAAASVFTERRYEPFGEEIESYVEPAGGGAGVIGDVDFSREAQNSINKQTDPDTGWSYHGARWMAPETARWLTPDPPVKAPDVKFMAEPWALHPYQYVEQNPVIFWDPDGRDKKRRPVATSATNKRRPVDTSAHSRVGPHRFAIPKGGNPQYYRLRAWDFERRNPGMKAPDYYLGYGDKYLKRFTKLRPALGHQGQSWVLKTRELLQVAMDNRIKKDPRGFADAERDPDEFRDWAYGTHEAAYLQAGLVNVSWRDRYKIWKAPDWADKLSWAGLKQVFGTGTGLVSQDIGQAAEASVPLLERGCTMCSY